ncbi:PAS domain S-box protein [Azospirillum agricola]|uniref:PAS domain S-box protein n=1 Tax=Azospirillum agricola TaxID=1720247 RepID=UPI000A0F2E09|nr:PAS domain S-box protein [Azospirillum agricola]SMH36290.1 PAS domain S-box-containing protein [Azospirillum lipoferum]
MIRQRQHRGFSIAVWTATLGLTAALWGAALLLSRTDEADAMARAERDTGNLTRVVAEQTTRAVAEADQVMLFLIDDFSRHGGVLDPHTGEMMNRAAERSAILLQLSIIDERGELVRSSVEDLPPRLYVGDREHFRVHAENADVGLFIGKPVFGRASKRWAIQLTRRLARHDGSFAGVMVASMDPFYFSRVLERMDVGIGGSVKIVGTDGILRARSVLNERIMGLDVGDTATLRQARTQPNGFLHETSVIDGVHRLQSYRTLESYPLIVTAGFSESAFMAGTRNRQRLYWLGSAACTLGLFGLAALATRQSARLAASARRLAVSEQRFRDQAETASDWFWEMGADLRFSCLIGPLMPHTAEGEPPIGLRREDIALREPGDDVRWREHRRLLERHEPFRDFQYRVRTSIGVRHISVSGRPLFDEDGAFIGYRGSATDITERERAAERLQSSETRYRAMLAAVEQPIITVDENGVVNAFNPAAERLYGYPAAEIVGGPVRRLMPEAEGEIHEGLMEAYRRGEVEPPKSGVRDMVGRRKDGSEFPVEVTLAGWREGGRQYFTGAIRDVTAQREIEASLRRARDAADLANRMKGEFLATMSHEIRTPMNGVLGALALVDGPNLDAEQRQMLDVASRSGNALLLIIDDILDLSKLEAGKVDLEPVDFELRNVLADTIDLLQPTATGRGLTLTTEVAPPVPQRLRADMRRIRQVLVNLIGNALKFTHRGGVTVRVSMDGAPRPDGSFPLRFEVTDSGIGISEAVLPSLFRRFTQADSSTTRRFGGTGLGLAICRELVALMDGRIGVVSTEGKGSTFWFTVACRPAPSAAGEEAEDRAAPPHGSAAPAGGLRLLVAEDNEINREIVVAMLGRAGHSVTAVTDGLQAVRAVEAQKFDAVLMDVQMPVMDGITATRHIRAMPGAAREIPVVALTGNAMPGNRDEYLAAGMTAYLPKPIVSSDLFKTLAAVTRPPALDELLDVTLKAPREQAAAVQG